MFFLLKNWVKSDKLSFKMTKIRIVKEFFSIKWLLSILVLGLSTLVVSASSIKYKSELLSDALVYSDAGLWDKAFNVVSKSSDQVLVDLIVWLKLREGLGSKFEYVDFIRENPHWPGMQLLRRQAEKKIYNDYKNNKIQLDESLLVLFSNFAPQTGEGLIILLEILSKMGQDKKLEDVLLDSWLLLEFSNRSFVDFIEKYSERYNLDFADRIEELLWNNRHEAIEKENKVSSYVLSKTQMARFKLQRQERGVTQVLSQLSTTDISSTGIVFERFRYRINKGFFDSASDLIISQSRKGKQSLERPLLWANYRMRLVKNNMRQLNFLKAYEIASKHYLTSSQEHYFNLEWIAGFISYQYLYDYETALKHFQKSFVMANSSESKAKLQYFIGKAHDKLSNELSAKSAYLEASQYIDTVHGQVASELLSVSSISLENVFQKENIPPTPLLTLDTFKVGLLLSYSGRIVLGDWFLQHSARLLSIKEKAELLYLLNETGHHLSVISIISDSEVLRKEFPFANYPIPKFWNKPKLGDELYLAITREESKFYIGSRSSTGAQGLMQLMPKTAQMISYEINLPYLPNRLRVDWEYNVKLGSHYIRKLLKRYDNSYPLALAAYNAGPSRVNSWLKLYGDPRTDEIEILSWIQCIPFDETRGYVSRVLASMNIYKGILHGERFLSNYLDNNFFVPRE